MNLSGNVSGNFFKFLVAWLSIQPCLGQGVTQTHVELFQTRKDISIRALYAINENVCWFASSKGVWGLTIDGGKHWKVDSIVTDSMQNEFRAITALNDSTCLILSTGPPAFLYKTQDYGKSWKRVYSNLHSKIFFDAMYFENDSSGYAIADPIEGQFQIIKTSDAGESWFNFNTKIPLAEDGEACFAASNSILRANGSRIWFVTGGKKSRLLYYRNDWENNKGQTIPMEAGGDLTGTFSFDMFTENLIAFAGGNYQKSDADIKAFAMTWDGGITIEPIKTPTPFFGSCVKFLSDSLLIVTGHHGTYLFNISKNSWGKLMSQNNEELKFNTISLNKYSEADSKCLWLAGNKGLIAKIKLK